LSTLPYYNLDNNDDSIIEPSVDFISNDQPTHPTYVDPTSKYLYALHLHLYETNSDHTQFYADSSHNNEDVLQAHMDANSMTSTPIIWIISGIQNFSMTLLLF